MYKRVIYKYHSLERIETDKNNVISAFLDNMTYCEPSNVVILKTIFHVAFSDSKYAEVYTLPVKYTELIEKGRQLRNARQYIADVYHCSDIWGQKNDRGRNENKPGTMAAGNRSGRWLPRTGII